jgi:2-oxoglutarate ferredoxin oxidoreductase subunit gamma
MSQQAFDSYINELQPDGLLIVDPDMVDEPDKRKDVRVLRIPAATTADSIGNRIIANMIMLGAIQGKTGMVTESSLKKSIEESVPKRFVELNLKAMNEGRKIVANKDKIKL